MTTPRYRSILREMFGAILQSNLSNRDLFLLSNELRRGQLPDELAYMIEQATQHFGGDSTSRAQNSFVKQAEDKIKSKKLPKEALINIIGSIGSGDIAVSPRSLTIRDILERFFDNASPRKADQLLDILDTAGSSDPFLKGISENRP